MNKLMKWLLGVIIFLLYSTTEAPIYADSMDTVTPLSIVKEQVNAENQKDTEKMTKIWTTETSPLIKQVHHHGYSHGEEGEQATKAGINTIESAKIVDSRPLPAELVSSISNFSYYESRYGEENVKPYYVAVDYKVKQESDFYQNGVNYFLAIVVKEDDEWKMAEFSVAPVDLISKNNEGFNTEDEKKVIELQKRRVFGGAVTNQQGNLLFYNTPSEYILHGGTHLHMAQRLRTPPKVIKVFITNKHNGKVGTVKEIDFNDYIKNVLPNEWDLSSKDEALKAGALAVKMYGWYYTKYPGLPLVGAHVRDNTTFQMWVKETEEEKTKITNPHIESVKNIGFYSENLDNLFAPQYRRSSKDWKGSGCMPQLGTMRLAKNGKNFKEILSWYYDNSKELKGGKMIYFNY